MTLINGIDTDQQYKLVTGHTQIDVQAVIDFMLSNSYIITFIHIDNSGDTALLFTKTIIPIAV